MTNKSSLTDGQKIIKYTAMTLAILLIAGIASGIAGIIEAIFGEGLLGEMRRYEVTEDVTELEMEIGGGAFSVVYAEGFAVESNIASLNVSASRGKLRVKEKITFGRTDGGAKIILYVPENFVFETAEIETGAGDFNLSSFSAKQLSLSLGAGKVVIGELTVTGEAEIDGGAGAFTINGGSIRSLDFDMGVGDAQIRTELLGQCELNFGIGKASITLLGGAENYKLDIEKGIGRVTVGGEEQHGSTVYGIGNTLVDIECGIGEVNVSFE